MADFVGGQERVVAESAETVDVYSPSPPFSVVFGNSLNSKLCRNSGNSAFRTVAGGVQVIEAYARDINGVGREHVRPGAGRLIGMRGLETLLERAAVSDAAEDAWDVLRIVIVS